jgi:undecaprenyl-diphosphatase
MMRNDNYALWILLTFCAAGFCMVSILVKNQGIAGFDSLVATWVQSTQSDRLFHFSKQLAVVGAPKLLMKAAVSLALLGVGIHYFASQQRLKALAQQLILFGAINIATYYSNFWLKDLFQRTRPLAYIPSYSYPSGHAMLSFAFYMTAAYLLWKNIPTKVGRIVVTIGCSLLTLLIGLSRVYLSWHYPSDIVGGYFASGGILLAGALLFEWRLYRNQQS